LPRNQPSFPGSTDDRVNIDLLLKKVNEKVSSNRSELDACYAKARELHKEGAPR